MKNISQTKAITAREGFREQDIWRKSLGIFEPLYAFSVLSGDLDAPDVLPSGSSRSTNYGPMLNIVFRD